MQPDFAPDGCTGFFDEWRGIVLRYCCDAHDLAWYQHPGDWSAWLASNIDLARCFWEAGAWEIAILGFVAVSTIGALLFAGLIRKPQTTKPRPSGGASLLQQRERPMISKAQIYKLCPTAAPELVGAIISGWHLAEDAGIDTPRRVRHFFARVAVETGGLRAVEESLSYSSASRLRKVWPTRFKSDEAAQPFVRNPKKLAIKVYGGRLGNAPAPSPDGWDFRGGGMMQTTGRDNYRKMGFEDDPEALRDPDTAFATAVREWKNRNCNDLADKDDTVAVCKAINGGTNGLAEQRSYLLKAERIWPDGAAVAHAPDDDERLVQAVQTALISKGYHEVGEPDGDYGSKTRTAILGFEADHGLPLTGLATADLLASILTAEHRPVSEARAEGKPEDNKVVKDSNILKTIGGVVTGGSLLSFADPVVEKIEGGAGLVARVKTAIEPLIGLWPLFAVAAGVAVIVYAIRSQRQVVKDYQSGKLAR